MFSSQRVKKKTERCEYDEEGRGKEECEQPLRENAPLPLPERSLACII